MQGGAAARLRAAAAGSHAAAGDVRSTGHSEGARPHPGRPLSLAADAQFVFLGTGEERYEAALREIAATVPDRVAVETGFTDEREHRLLAGADVLLMPSLYEPCGLTQMRAQRYGALPVGRRVGGLADTVEDEETGFLFDDYTPAALERAVGRALGLYEEREAWERHMRQAMARDFSWSCSVTRYLEVYQRALSRCGRA